MCLMASVTGGRGGSAPALFHVRVKLIYYWFLSKLTVPRHVWTHLSSLLSYLFPFFKFAPLHCSLIPPLSHQPSFIFSFCCYPHPCNPFLLHISSPLCRSLPYMPTRHAHGAVAVQVLKRSTVRSGTSPPYQKHFLKTQRGSTWGKTPSLISTHAHRSNEILLSEAAQRGGKPNTPQETVWNAVLVICQRSVFFS